MTSDTNVGVIFVVAYLFLTYGAAAPPGPGGGGRGAKGGGGSHGGEGAGAGEAGGGRRGPAGPRQFKARCTNGSMYVGWTHVEPYMVRGIKDATIEAQKSPHGVMYEFLEKLVGTCCGAGVDLTPRTEFTNPVHMESSVYSDTTFNLPVIKTQLQQTFDESRPNYTFLPVVETPGEKVCESIS